MSTSITLLLFAIATILLTAIILFIAYQMLITRLEVKFYLKNIKNESDRMQEMLGAMYEMTGPPNEANDSLYTDQYTPTDTTDYSSDSFANINWPTTMDTQHGTYCFNPGTDSWDNMEDVDGLTPEIIKDLEELFDMENPYEGPTHLKNDEEK